MLIVMSLVPILCLQGCGMMVSPSGSPERARAHPIQAGFRRNHNGGGQVKGLGGLFGREEGWVLVILGSPALR